MKSKEYPILEFDPTLKAVIEPSEQIKPIEISKTCVVCFFKEVIDKYLEKNKLNLIKKIKTEMGSMPVYELKVSNQKKITIFHPGIGAPLAAGMLEEVIALGGRKFVACGGAGVLNKEITVGKLIVPNSAVRDEGVSYHYIKPGREIRPTQKALSAVKKTLKNNNIDYISGKTWTTASFYRETTNKINLRRDEGCIVVEMESAAFFAVANFRNVEFAQILYGGDDVSGELWDKRDWDTRKTIRENIFLLSLEAALNI
ncbi:MAG: nucleoside phosphorylase [Halanaerobiales bacterium]|nr:nucleoside phosphorylase [Halanaerobiales bacterium]